MATRKTSDYAPNQLSKLVEFRFNVDVVFLFIFILLHPGLFVIAVISYFSKNPMLKKL